MITVKKSENTSRTVTFSGISWLAAFWSYAVNHSIAWAILHGLMGPIYIACRIVFHTNLLPR